MPNKMGEPTKPSQGKEPSMSQNSPTEHVPQYKRSKRRNEDSDDKTPSRKRAKERFRMGGNSNKRQDMGRNQYFRSAPEKRKRLNDKKQKQDRNEEQPVYLLPSFSKEEIEAEGRKPKRKVAVMIGYSGSGYKGMQLMPDQRTIEGDLFQAFVATGAISKANADDPRKSSLVRCARTDKGVHAAGNVISLKLIIEDPDLVSKINSHLDPRIRVWGIQRTTSSFSCYSACDSRWYEYLIPTSCFLPPHPSTFLATQLAQIAAEDEKTAEINERQQDVLAFWEDFERKYITPILEGLSPELRERVEQALYKTDSVPREEYNAVASMLGEDDEVVVPEDNAEQPTSQIHNEPELDTGMSTSNDPNLKENDTTGRKSLAPELEKPVKSLKAAYIAAKKAYRISPSRVEHIRRVLAKYEGTHNFHNFTIRKSAKDPSAKRFIKSFEINGDPVIINDSEWLSLKVHGQSFMMHQIRKMVAMAALVVRSGTPLERMDEVMSEEAINIPKAPSLGLLLERPVFDNYNKFKAAENDKEDIDFATYEKEMLEFKQREIYDRIFEEEEKDNVFHTFFTQIDNYREPTFLFISSRGLAASTIERPQRAKDSALQTKTQNSRRRDGRSRSPSWQRSQSPSPSSKPPVEEAAAAGASA